MKIEKISKPIADGFAAAGDDFTGIGYSVDFEKHPVFADRFV
jgi:hypothetical protein